MNSIVSEGYHLLEQDQTNILAKYKGLSSDLYAAGLRSEFFTYFRRLQAGVPINDYERKRYRELKECPAVKESWFFDFINSRKRFILTDQEGNNIFGGELTSENVYIKSYAVYEDLRTPFDLEIGDFIKASFHLSGTKGYYWLKRVK